MKRKQHEKAPGFAPDPEQGGGINPMILWFIIALMAVMMATTAVYCEWIPVALVFWLVFLISAMKILRSLFRQHDDEYRYRRLYSDSLNAFEKRLRDVEDKLKETEDKPIQTPHHGMLRPGSKPSIQYLDMIVHKEDKHGVR